MEPLRRDQSNDSFGVTNRVGASEGAPRGTGGIRLRLCRTHNNWRLTIATRTPIKQCTRLLPLVIFLVVFALSEVVMGRTIWGWPARNVGVGLCLQRKLKTRFKFIQRPFRTARKFRGSIHTRVFGYIQRDLCLAVGKKRSAPARYLAD